MRNEDFLINLDRLKKSGPKSLDMTLPSTFLDAEDKELHFGEEVTLRGEAYVVDERLILHIDVLVPAVLPCTICNGDAALNVKIHNLYHIEEIKDLKSPIYDFSQVLKEEILLEVPRFAECHDGNCPERDHIKTYLGSTKS